MSALAWVLLAVGGGAGAAARYLTDTLLARRAPQRRLPAGTLLINVLGSAALGALAATTSSTSLVYAAAGIGFCGGFTTFSTFTWETLALAEDGLTKVATGNLVAHLLLGVAAAGITYWAV